MKCTTIIEYPSPSPCAKSQGVTAKAKYAQAREFEATFWTQDVDYQGLPGEQYFPKA
ncbi:MAG: hypothetical protein K9K38_07805 [Rhodoferax sp.]|nr:hypothetical protein [Rhodoferax sp.]MCF8209290.1 hypothetical protein [Rhodoferax sp.]